MSTNPKQTFEERGQTQQIPSQVQQQLSISLISTAGGVRVKCHYVIRSSLRRMSLYITYLQMRPGGFKCWFIFLRVKFRILTGRQSPKDVHRDLGMEGNTTIMFTLNSFTLKSMCDVGGSSLYYSFFVDLISAWISNSLIKKVFLLL